MTLSIFTLCNGRVKQSYEDLYTNLARLLQISKIYFEHKAVFKSLWNVKSNANISRHQTREGVHS